MEGECGHRSTQASGGTFTHFHTRSLITPQSPPPDRPPLCWVPREDQGNQACLCSLNARAVVTVCAPTPDMLPWTTGTQWVLN